LIYVVPPSSPAPTAPPARRRRRPRAPPTSAARAPPPHRAVGAKLRRPRAPSTSPIVPHERRAPELDPPPECRRAASTPPFRPFGVAGEVRRRVLHPVRASPGPLRPRLRRAGRRVPRRRRPHPCVPPATPRRRRAAASPLLHPPARLDADAAPSSLSPTWYGPAAGHFFFFFYYRIIYILFVSISKY